MKMNHTKAKLKEGLRSMSVKKVEKALKELKNEYFVANSQRWTGNVKKQQVAGEPDLKIMRKKIAIAKTILYEKAFLGRKVNEKRYD